MYRQIFFYYVGSAKSARGPVFTQLIAPPPLPVRELVIMHFAPARNLWNEEEGGGALQIGLDEGSSHNHIISLQTETSMTQMIAEGAPSTC